MVQRHRHRKLLLWNYTMLVALYLCLYDSPFTGTGSGTILFASAKQTPSTPSVPAPAAASFKRGSPSNTTPAQDKVLGTTSKNNNTSPATATTTNHTATASVYQLTETEVYDDLNRVWKAAEAAEADSSSGSGGIASTSSPSSSTTTNSARWTDVTGRASLAPDKLVPTSGTEFVGDWKIVTGSGRDAYGWEYSNRPSPSPSKSASSIGSVGATNANAMMVPVRRRTWLRTLQPISISTSTTPTLKASTSLSKTAASTGVLKATTKSTRTPTTPTTTKAKRQRSRQQQRRSPLIPKFLLPSVWIRAVRDDFNFKGFGWSLYKSLQEYDSVGLALKLPLTYNFDTWERHPALPSLQSSICIYQPACIILFVSGSMRVEWIKWAAARLSYYIIMAVCQMAGNLVRGLCLAVSAVLYPVTRQLYDPAWTKVDHYRNSQWTIDQEQQGLQGPNYSRTVEEFIGVSVSWRVSVTDGYEFRVGYWHFYAPTVVSIWRAVTDMVCKVIPVQSRKTLQQKTQLPVWFARHSAALGMSTSAPMPDPPHVACTGLLSLSGFYFQTEKASSKKATTTTSSSSTNTATSTAATINTATTSATSAATTMDSSGSESELEENSVSSKKKNVLLTAPSTATAANATETTTKSPWQLLREKETAIAAAATAAELALESASPDKKKEKPDDDPSSQKKKKSSNKKQPSLHSTSSAYL